MCTRLCILNSSCVGQLGKTRFHKSHHFDKAEGDLKYTGESKPGIGAERRPTQFIPPPTTFVPRGAGVLDLPAWVVFDKQVLSFDAYFQEAVTECRVDQYRIRRVKIYFYLEDDSVQVVEPRMRNTALNQGLNVLL